MEALASEARELATADDVDTQALWRSVLVEDARPARGARGGRDARAGGARHSRADRRGAAQVRSLGRPGRGAPARGPGREEARDALAQAGELAEIKGAPVMVAAARTRLAAATERTLAS